MSDAPEDIAEIDRVYPIRITEPAIQDIEDAYRRFVELTGVAHANEWKDGLFDRVRTLATMPRKHPIAPESSRFGFEVRDLSYRLRRGVTYRVLFRVVDPSVSNQTAADPSDPAYVRILHVRHGARRPMTKPEAAARMRTIDSGGSA